MRASSPHRLFRGAPWFFSMQRSRLLLPGILVLALACSDDEVAPCEIQQLDVTLTGTIDDLEAGPVPLSLSVH
jgi:hypothetical protein